MKNRRPIVMIISMVFALTLFLGTPAMVLAGEPAVARRTVRIAFPSQGGMSGVGSSGDLEGYNYEYLQELAKYAGWKMEYITFEDQASDDGIMNAMSMVMSGEADLIGPMLKSAEVEEMFDFPKDNYGVVYTTLCALEKSEITSVNYSKLEPLRVALYASATTRNKEVIDYLDQLGIKYEVISCESSDEQIHMLEEGKADVLSSITLSYFSGTRSVAQFAPRPYYFVTTKGNSELLNELDLATAELNYTRPYLQQQLQEKYYGDTSSGYVLTDAEQESMKKLETISVLCDSKKEAPYVQQDSDGRPAGLMVSLLNDFAELNKLKVSYTFCDSPEEVEREWKTGSYNCRIGIPRSSEYCTENGVICTETITSANLVLYAKPQMEKPFNESTVAVFKELATQMKFDDYKKVLTFDEPEECYEAVESGEADYGCADRLLTEYALFERNSNLATIPMAGEETDICIGVSVEMNIEFISALNKFIHTLPDSTITTYLSDGSHHTADNALVTWIRFNPIGAALAVSAIVILCMSTILFGIYASRSKRKNVELQKANSAKSEFLARMSHDIRTPMNAIIGYISIAKDTEGCPQKVEHCLDNSEVAAKHLLQLINDILDMSSIESGKLKIAEEEFDLKPVISDATTIFHQTSKIKGIHFSTVLDGLTEEWLVGDSLRVNQIVMNLLSNAMKFTPEGGSVQLEIKQQKTDESGTDLEISVKDTGIGMSEAYMERLFQPFEQEEASTARKFGGSGLGLSIVHSLVLLMGGSIQVKSKQNAGTTFTVNLHFAKASHAQGDLEAAVNRKVRALLLSEDQEKAKQLQKMLQTLEVKADIITDRAYAVKRVRRRLTSEYPYSLCLIDWDHFGKESEKVITDLKQELGQSRMSIIAVGYDITEFEEKAKSAGADSCMALPVFRSEMMSLIQVVSEGGSLQERKKKQIKFVDFTGKRVLLAEDNKMNMEIAVTILGKTKLEIVQAENGKQALELFEKSQPGTFDFILMDVQMPVMDGYEATKAIRSLERPDAATIPIIAMTANAFAEDVNVALANGMNDHVSKPISYDRLFHVLYRFI